MGAQTLDGHSLLPFADADPVWPRPVHYAEYHGDWYGHYSSRMVTDGRHKLIWNFSDLGEFYDLESDPHELVNRFYDPDARPLRDECFRILVREAERLGDGQLKFLMPEVEDTLWECGNDPLPIRVP